MEPPAPRGAGGFGHLLFALVRLASHRWSRGRGPCAR